MILMMCYTVDLPVCLVPVCWIRAVFAVCRANKASGVCSVMELFIIIAVIIWHKYGHLLLYRGGGGSQYIKARQGHLHTPTHCICLLTGGWGIHRDLATFYDILTKALLLRCIRGKCYSQLDIQISCIYVSLLVISHMSMWQIGWDKNKQIQRWG